MINVRQLAKARVQRYAKKIVEDLKNKPRSVVLMTDGDNTISKSTANKGQFVFEGNSKDDLSALHRIPGCRSIIGTRAICRRDGADLAKNGHSCNLE